MSAPVPPAPTTPEESRRRITEALLAATKVAVGTHAGEEVRVRMMHPGAYVPDEPGARPVVYLASMKNDPKIREMTTRPEVALLMTESPTGEEHTTWEMEVTGRAEVVRDAAERARACEATKRTSSIVNYLDSIGQTDLLAFVKVTPRFMKHRIFGEIVAGRPPSILEFAGAGQDVSDRALLAAKLGVWKEMVRWPSLTASIASVFVGLAAAWATTGALNLWWGLVTMVGAVALQACTNIKNDLDDQLSGADDRNRTPILGFTGGSRVLQRGLATRAEMLFGMLVFGLVATVIGAYFALNGRAGVIVWGLAGLLIGFVYTGRPLVLANKGLGELCVGLAFGVGIVTGTTYVQVGYVPAMAWAASIPVSILVGLILFINGFQDAESDAAVGKRTLVTRLGLERAAKFYIVLPAVAMAALVAGVATGALPTTALFGFAGVPLFFRAQLIAADKYASPMELVPANAFTAVGHLACAMGLAVGLAWSAAGERGAYIGYAVVALGVLVIAYYWRSIARLSRAFEGVRDAVAAR